jgi:hypothetical protein
MDISLPRQRIAKRGIQAMTVAALLTFTACGGGGDDSSAKEANKRKTTTTAATDRGAPTTAAGSTAAAEPVLVLPLDAEAPEGFRAAAEYCRADPGTTDEEGTHRTWIGYAVPEAWKNAGFSGGGSGGPHDSQALKFDVDGGNSLHGMVEVGVDWDSRSPDGTVLDANGDPFTSFDYEITTMGDETTTTQVTYDEVGTVDIGEGSADLFYRDPAQSPDDLGTTAQYKARVAAYELPRNQGEPGELTPSSFVVTVEFDAEDTPLESDVIEKILGSFTMPQCTWDKVLADAELQLGVDLDGDGKTRDAEDAQAELQENLDAMRDRMPPEARERYDEMRSRMEGSADD